METKSVLGRGLRALIPDTKENDNKARIVEVPIQDIIANEYQPREYFDQDKLNELAASIKTKGLMQPIVVRRKNDKYEIIAGERRYRACSQLKMSKIPVVVKNADDKESFELAIVENIQRQDLNLMEKAKAFRQLIEDFDLTQQEISKQLGIERSTIANTVRLLSLPAHIQKRIEEGLLSFGHAKVLLSIDNAEDQFVLCEQILKENLTVREVEEEVKQYKKHIKKKAAKKQDPFIADIEDNLQKRLGTKVGVNYNSRSKKGSIKIDYFSDDDLNRILQILGCIRD